MGAPGPAGSTGASGPSGSNGSSGTAGGQGATGASGTNGTTGAVGATGATGLTGLTGATGINAFTQTTASFTAPAANGNVTITVTPNTGGWMATGQIVFISGGAGYYQVVTPGATSITVKNLGYPGNATSGTIATNQTVSPGGVQGATGAVGVTGATGAVGVTGATGVAGPTGVGATGPTGAGATGPTGPAGGTTVNAGTASPTAVATVPAANVTYTSTSSSSCSGSPPGCLSVINSMGSVTATISTVTGCTAAATQKLIITAQNLPSSVWVQNAVCNGTNTAAVTLISAKTNATTSVPTSTVFTYMLIP